MKLITALLFSGLTGLLPCILSADEAAPNVAVDQDADGALAKLAAATRDAVFMLQVGNGPSSYGVFISADGLALVNPQSLLLKRKPKIVAADDKIVKFGKILGMFPEQELVLMKFDHRPKAFVPLAPVEPALGESIALVPLNRERPWKGEIPIVVGPIIAKRSSTTPNLRVARFTKIVSIGTGLSFKQRRALGPGCFATDRKGQLVAFTNSFSRERGQTLITLAPIVALSGKINELTKGGIHLGFPIPDSKNPYDLAAIDPGFHPMNLAMIHQNWTEFERLLKGLQKRYPNSDMLKSKYISLKLALWEGGVDAKLMLDLPKPDPNTSVAQQVELWSIRAIVLAQKGQNDAAIKAFQTAIALCPKDYPNVSLQLATLYVQLERFDDAETIYRQVYASFSDSIPFIEQFEDILGKLKKPDEAEKMTKRFYELVRIYKRP